MIELWNFIYWKVMLEKSLTNNWIWLFQKPLMAPVIRKYLLPSDAINACQAFLIPQPKVVIQNNVGRTYETVVGLKHGSYTSRYKKGNLQETGTYVNGEKHGEFKEFGTGGNLIQCITYANGKMHGPSTSKTKQGKTEIKEYDNGSHVKTSLYKDDKLLEVSHYYNGCAHGMLTIYDDGKPHAERPYVNGKLRGLCINYNTEKDFLSDTFWAYNHFTNDYWKRYHSVKSGKLCESWSRPDIESLSEFNDRHQIKVYRDDGSVKEERNQKGLDFHGMQRWWYDNGQLEEEVRYVNGVEDGFRKKWTSEGKLISMVYCNNGKSKEI